MNKLTQVIERQIEYEDYDYFIVTNGSRYYVSQGLVYIGTAATWIGIVHIIRKHARSVNFFPNVWKAQQGENWSHVADFKY